MKNIVTIILLCVCFNSFSQDCDSTQYYRIKYDSLYSKHIVIKFKFERIKYYVGICNRNPKQTVFLRGWMNRVIK
jgi:hypothetical protein